MNNIKKIVLASLLMLPPYGLADSSVGVPVMGVINQAGGLLTSIAAGNIPSFGLDTLPVDSLAVWGSLTALSNGSPSIEMLPIDPGSLSAIGSSGEAVSELLLSRIYILIDFVGSVSGLDAEQYLFGVGSPLDLLTVSPI
jgi:hypothetical protein